MQNEQSTITGYPSIDKPWMKYYSEEAIKAPLPECSAFEMLYTNNKEYFKDIAINYLNKQISYGELFNMIDGTARAFYKIGVRKNDVVAFCTANMPEIIAALYGLNKLGAKAVLLDPRMNPRQINEYINECHAKIVVSLDSLYGPVNKAVRNSTAKTIVFISPINYLLSINHFLYAIKNHSSKNENKVIWWNDFIEEGKNCEYPICRYEKDRCFIISFTGGTTGIPKGVMLSDDCLNAVAHGYKYVGIPFKRQDKFYNDLPFFIVYGLSLGVHSVLSHGLQLILYPIFKPKKFPRLFKKYKPNHFSAGADHLRYLAESPLIRNMDLSFLCTAAMGGDTLNEKTEKDVNNFLKEHGCEYEVVKGYGMTELGATCCTTFKGANAYESVGIPLVMNTISIRDIDSGEELQYGQMGEIWVSSPSIMLGYLNSPNSTEQVISTDKDGTRWIRTGDMGYINENGLLFHKGRIRRIYLTQFAGAPAKIFPVFVEQIIKKLPEIYDCTVVARYIKGTTYYEPVAYIIPNKACNIDKRVISSYCDKNLPTYMKPVEVVFVETFPRTSIGKVDYRALEKNAEELDKKWR